MDYGGYAPMLRITMNGATMNGAVVTSAGVQRSLLPLQLTLSPHASCLTFSDVLNNSCYAAPFEGVGALVQLDGLRARRWVRGAQHQRARVHLGWQHIELVGLVMLALALCAGPETGGTVLTIGDAPRVSHRLTARRLHTAPAASGGRQAIWWCHALSRALSRTATACRRRRRRSLYSKAPCKNQGRLLKRGKEAKVYLNAPLFDLRHELVA